MAAGVIATIGMSVTTAHAGVGVTSATDGDPLGRPPSAAERVLRVGIDIQANEFITTRADDRAHILFLDGTSLTVAPNAQLVIDRYVYDPNTKTGDIAVSVSKGVLRLVGGKISKNTPMVVTTPSATIGIRGGIAVIVADAQQTQANFLFGTSMTVSANGRTEMATRAGSQIVTRLGNIPGAPVVIPAGGLTSQLAALEGRTGRPDRQPDEAARASGFSSANSGQVHALTVNQRQPAPPPPAINNVAAQAVSNAGVDRQPLSETSGALILLTATPRPGPSAVPQIVVTLPSVNPVIPSLPTPSPVVPPVTAAVTALGGGYVPAIQRPDVTPVVGVGNGSLAVKGSPPSFPQTKPSTTPSAQPGPIFGTTPSTGGSTKPDTGAGTKPNTGGGTTFGPGSTIVPNKPNTGGTTPPVLTNDPTKRGATPAVGVGNGGLVHAIPPANSRGGNGNAGNGNAGNVGGRR